MLGTLVHVLSLFSSSYIEEEHQLLYHLWTGFSAIQAYKTFIEHYYTSTAMWVVSMVLHRFCKDLNYVGNQWSGFYSLGDWFRESQNQVYLSVLMFFGMLYWQYLHYFLRTIIINCLKLYFLIKFQVS